MTRWTRQQQTIINLSPKPGDRVLVAAVAGAGKTTVATALMQKLAAETPDKQHLMVSFGRADKENTASRVTMPNIEISTFDSIVYKHVMSKYGAKTTYTESDWTIAQQLVDEWEPIVASCGNDKPLLESWRKTRVRKRGAAAPCFQSFKIKSDIAQGVLPLLNTIFSAKTEDELQRSTVPSWALSALKYSGQEEAIRLSKSYPLVMMAMCRVIQANLKAKMTFLPEFSRSLLANDPPDLGYFTICVDESQDLSRNMLSTIMAQKNSGIIFIGDKRQHIFAFNNCLNAFETIKDVTRYDLSTSWRFGPNIADFARRFLPPGDVLQGGNESCDAVFTSTSLSVALNRARSHARRNEGVFPKIVVLCRTNKGVCKALTMVKDIIERKTSPFMEETMREEYGITLAVAGASPPWSLLNKEINSLKSMGTAAYMKTIREKTSGWEKHVCSTGVMNAEITQRFLTACGSTTDRATIVVSTVHRFKGQESEWAVVWEDVRCMSLLEGDTQSSSSEGESENESEEVSENAPSILAKDVERRNVAYVACTRAKDCLFVC